MFEHCKQITYFGIKKNKLKLRSIKLSQIGVIPNFKQIFSIHWIDLDKFKVVTY